MNRPRLFAQWIVPLVVLLIPLGASTAAAAPAPASGPTVFVAITQMSGAQEVPPVTDTAGRGTAIYQLSPDGTELYYTLVATRLTSTPTAAHIHGPAVPGKDAPIEAFLFPPSGTGSCSSTSALLLECQGAITAADLRGPLAEQPLSALITQMAAGLSYTNVHTVLHPMGEIRGQNVPLIAFSSPLVSSR
jgi:hypothetical protein